MSEPSAVALRRALHRIPELGFEVHRTAAAVDAELATWGRPSRVVGRTGRVVDLGDPAAERRLLLRADMDGLPVQEATGLPFASEHAGHMHACGHDAHMAALLVAGRGLAAAPPAGLGLRVLFQPAEEGAGGAVACIEDGCLEGVDVAFGIHVWNELPLGTVAATAGGIMAGVVEVVFTVDGRGGHGALPHRAVDPVVASAQLVMALQTAVSRKTSPFEPAVLTIGAVHAGEAFNVIPDRAVLRGTARAFSLEGEAALERDVRAIAAGVAAATGTEIGVAWTRHCIPTVNDAGVAAEVARAAAGVGGVRDVVGDYQTMAGEDFGYILARVPGCFVLVGSGPADGSPAEPHHSPRFDIDEGVLDVCVGLHRAVAEAFAG